MCHFKDVSRMFQECFKSVLRVFKGCFKEVLSRFLGGAQDSFKVDLRNLHGKFKAVS